MKKYLITTSLLAGVLTLGLTGCGESSTTYTDLTGNDNLSNESQSYNGELSSYNPYNDIKQTYINLEEDDGLPMMMYISGSNGFEPYDDHMDINFLYIRNDSSCSYSKHYGIDQDPYADYDCTVQFVDSQKQIVVNFIESGQNKSETLTINNTFKDPYSAFYIIENNGVNYTSAGGYKMDGYNY